MTTINDKHQQANTLEVNRPNLQVKVDHGEQLINNIGGSADKTVTRFEVGSMLDNSEIVEDGESLGFSEDGKKKAGDSDLKGKKNDNHAAKIISEALKLRQEPTVKYMTREIKKDIHKKITEIQRNIAKLERNIVDNACELTKERTNLKKLTWIVHNLMHWTKEKIKNLFMFINDGGKIEDAKIPQE